MDLSAAWRLSRLIKQLQPDVAARARSARRRDGGAGAVDEHATRPQPPLVAARRVDFHMKGNALSRWKYRQVDCFICASEAIRQMLIADGVPAARAVTVHEGIDLGHVEAAPAADLHAELWLPHHAPIVGNVAALVPHKGQRHLIEAAALVVKQVPDARFVIAGEGELRPALERQIKDHHLEKHVFLDGLPSRHPVGPQGVRHLRHELGDRGARHVAARRDGLRQADRRDDGGRHAGGRQGREDRAPGAAARPRGDGRRDRPAADRRRAARRRWARRPRARRASSFSAERMVQDTLDVYRRVAMHAHVEA